RFSRDWSSDVCSSDLEHSVATALHAHRGHDIRVGVPPVGDEPFLSLQYETVGRAGNTCLGNVEMGSGTRFTEGKGRDVLATGDQIGRASCREGVEVWR